jgi:hypothetical protein
MNDFKNIQDFFVDTAIRLDRRGFFLDIWYLGFYKSSFFVELNTLITRELWADETLCFDFDRDDLMEH